MADELFFTPPPSMKETDGADSIPRTTVLTSQKNFSQEVEEEVEDRRIVPFDFAFAASPNTASPNAVKVRQFAVELKEEQAKCSATSARLAALAVVEANPLFREMLAIMSSGLLGQGGTHIFRVSQGVRVI